MENLSLETIDNNFSPELLTLLGEWLTFAILVTEKELQEPPVPTMRELFETGIISKNGPFVGFAIEYGPPSAKITVYNESFLESYGVTGIIYNGNPTGFHIEPIVGYDEVKQTFRENLSRDNTPIFPFFACFGTVMPKAEYIEFSCDAGSYPLVKAFCTEGYMAQVGEMFHWTPKVRPIMEMLGTWKSIQDVECEAREAVQDEKENAEGKIEYQRFFDESLSTESIAPIVNYIRENGDFTETTLPIDDTLKMLEGLDFWAVIEMFRPSENDLKPSTEDPSTHFELVWRGDPV